METNIEALVRESERLKVVAEYVENCLDSKYQVIDKDILCWLLGIENKEREANS